MGQEICQVEDASGRRYTLSGVLGKGGQGKVYAVKGGRLAVKIIARNASDSTRERLRRRLDFVKRLPLEQLPISRPLETLRSPYAGYVMEIMTAMKPIETIIRPPKNVESVKKWYTETGSLQRRLRLLARCAETLGQLHGKGLVYGDLSPNNVFVSSSPDNDEVWLIDTDNLHYESGPGMSRIWTRFYGAPEVVTGKRGVSTLTDAYSFAVLAFETLSLAHPFKGDLVEYGKPELEDKALAGELPWIDHPTDDTNRASRGIPRKLVLSPLLRKMSEQAFVDGLKKPLQRPGILAWAKRLQTAANLTLECPGCGGTYFYLREQCPWCDTLRPYFALFRVRLWVPDQDVATILDQKPVDMVAAAVPGTAVLSRRVAQGRGGPQSHSPSIEFQFDRLEKRFAIRSLDGQSYTMISENGNRQEPVDSRARDFPSTWRLHLGAQNERHRFVMCTVYRGK